MQAICLLSVLGKRFTFFFAGNHVLLIVSMVVWGLLIRC